MATDQTAALRKQLKIKTGVVKRLAKEQKMYTKERQDQKLKVDELVPNDDNEWEIKNGKKLLDESERMITDTNTRLGAAVNELKDLIATCKDDPALSEAQELLDAQKETEAVTL